ncbi:LysR family transcriptional regulator [Providencia hangzhouensis]
MVLLQAAEILHRTQSSISYTISKLEQTLEIEIFSLRKTSCSIN